MFDPRVKDTVFRSTRTLVIVGIALACIFPLMLSLFYGVGWSPKDNYHNVQLLVADLDGGIVGQAIRSAASNPSFPFSVTVVTTSSPEDAMHRVDAGDFNAALIAMPGASVALAAALADPAAPYNSSAATTFVFDEGRGGPSMATLLRFNVPPLAHAAANAAVSLTLFRQLAAAAAPAAAVNVAALVSPVGCTEIRLHPVLFPGESSAAGIGAPPAPPTQYPA